MPSPFQTKTLYDAIDAFAGGVNEGNSPLDLPPGVMAGAINTTVRGKFVTHRPAYRKSNVSFSDVGETVTPGPPVVYPTPSTQILTTAAFNVPAVGGTVALNVSPNYSGNNGDVQTLAYSALPSRRQTYNTSPSTPVLLGRSRLRPTNSLFCPFHPPTWEISGTQWKSMTVQTAGTCIKASSKVSRQIPATTRSFST